MSGAERDSPDFLEQFLLAYVWQNTLDKLTLNWEKITGHTASDAALNDLLSAIQIQSNFDVAFPPRKGIHQDLSYRDGFYISEGVILYNDCVVIPPPLRYQVLRTLHVGHRTAARASVFLARDDSIFAICVFTVAKMRPHQLQLPRSSPTLPPRPS